MNQAHQEAMQLMQGLEQQQYTPTAENTSSSENKAVAGIAFAKLVFSNVLTSVIIGKSGETINKLRQNNGVRVRISPTDATTRNEDRVCIISGAIDGVNQSIRQICDLIAANPERKSATSPEITSGVALHLNIPETCVSAVIGKKGSRITDIRNATGARVKVCDRGLASIPSDRLIVIQSEAPAKTAEAAIMIVGMIQIGPGLVDSMRFATPQDQMGNAEVAAHYANTPYGTTPGSSGHHFGTGPYGSPYCMGTASPSPMQGQAHFYPHSQSPVHAGPNRTRTPINGARALPHTAMHMQNMYPQPAASPYTLDYCQHACLEPMHMEKVIEMAIPIADCQVGHILGRQGNKIAEIKKSSGASISISQPHELYPGTDKRICKITGGIVSVHFAHALIYRRILDLESQEGLAGHTLSTPTEPVEPRLPPSGAE